MTDTAEQRLFAEIREITHTLRGNGQKGVVSRLEAVEETQRREAEERKERARQAAEDKKNSLWRRLLFHGATVTVTLLVTMVWINYINRTPSPVEKKMTAEEQQAKDETKRQLDEIKQTLKDVSDRQVAPTKPPARYVAPKPVAKPRRGAMLLPGEMHADSDPPIPIIGFSRIPLPEMKVPE